MKVIPVIFSANFSNLFRETFAFNIYDEAFQSFFVLVKIYSDDGR